MALSRAHTSNKVADVAKLLPLNKRRVSYSASCVEYGGMSMVFPPNLLTVTLP